MRRLIIIIVAGLVGIVITAWATKPAGLPPEVRVIRLSPAEANPFQKLYDELLKPSVKINTVTGSGSGVVVISDETGLYILSAAHVVGDESLVMVTFYDYRDMAEIKTASVVITDTVKDLALLRVETTNTHELTRMYCAKLANRDYQPRIFTPVWVVGCSLGLPPRPSFGHITSIDSSSFVSIRGYEVSAPILPGNSGGPVYDARTYEVIGIAVWVRVYRGQLITTMAGIVPIQSIYEFLDSATKTPSH